MIQDKTMNILAKERTKLLVMIDQEQDETKRMQLEEQLQALTESIERRKQELLGTKNTTDFVETKVEEELDKVRPRTKKLVKAEHRAAIISYRQAVEQVQKYKVIRKKLLEELRSF